MTYPIFVTCRDRVTCLVQLLDWLESVGHADEVYLVDNASTYPPLLEFYMRTRHIVIRLDRNLGHKSPWTSGVIRAHWRRRRFVVTDPDVLPVEDCPSDALERMAEVLDRNPNTVKCGFSIKIDDLPDVSRDGAVAWESKYWDNFDQDTGAYLAPIDTTFALHNGAGMVRHRYKPAYRLPAPYSVRHLPWYLDQANLDDEEAYYVAHADPTVSNWARHITAAAECSP